MGAIFGKCRERNLNALPEPRPGTLTKQIFKDRGLLPLRERELDFLTSLDP